MISLGGGGGGEPGIDEGVRALSVAQDPENRTAESSCPHKDGEMTMRFRAISLAAITICNRICEEL